jgi:hypothetical protein
MSDTASASASEFVEQLLVLAKAEHVNSDAVSKLVNRFVKSIDVEKKAKKEAKKDAKKNGKKEKSELDKPDNVYILYCREKRKSIADLPENKGKRPEEITCLLAAEWRKERAQNSSFIKGLQQKADEASLKYKMAKARAKEEKEEKEAKEKPEKGEKKKKREPSAYNIFYSQMMAQMKEEGMDATHIPKAITDKWDTMSAEEKNAFKGKALTPKKTKAQKAPDAPKKAKPEKKDKKAPKKGGEVPKQGGSPKQEDPKRELDFSGQ